MKKLTPLFLVFSSPAVALAHPGQHSGSDTSLMVHWLTQPDHLLLTLAGVAVVIGLCVAVAKIARKQRR
ncbi:MAG: hypothetical protein RLN76_12575 [Phycisphaeraceae bacterium]